ncbi:hypothetical protein BC829DRAFT_389732, partial [Chytridium lagenaria]
MPRLGLTPSTDLWPKPVKKSRRRGIEGALVVTPKRMVETKEDDGLDAVIPGRTGKGKVKRRVKSKVDGPDVKADEGVVVEEIMLNQPKKSVKTRKSRPPSSHHPGDPLPSLPALILSPVSRKPHRTPSTAQQPSPISPRHEGLKPLIPSRRPAPPNGRLAPLDMAPDIPIQDTPAIPDKPKHKLEPLTTSSSEKPLLPLPPTAHIAESAELHPEPTTIPIILRLPSGVRRKMSVPSSRALAEVVRSCAGVGDGVGIFTQGSGGGELAVRRIDVGEDKEKTAGEIFGAKGGVVFFRGCGV